MTALIVALLALVAGAGGVAWGMGYDMLFNIASSLCTWGNGPALTITSIVYSYIRPVGLSLALCYAIMEIMESITRSGSGANNITPELIFSPLLKFGICYLCIMYGLQIVSSLFGASNLFVTWVSNTIAAYDYGELASASGATVNGTLAKIFLELIPSLISMLSQIIAGVIIGIQIISIRIEMLGRVMFLPLGFASIAHGGASSPGLRYVKNLIGNIFTLGTILIVIKLTYMIAADITAFQLESDGAQQIFMTIYAVLFNGLIGPFACIGAINMVKSLIREAFGG